MVVPTTQVQSAMASSRVSTRRTVSSRSPDFTASRCSPGASRSSGLGETTTQSVSPKFFMARAMAPRLSALRGRRSTSLGGFMGPGIPRGGARRPDRCGTVRRRDTGRPTAKEAPAGLRHRLPGRGDAALGAGAHSRAAIFTDFDCEVLVVDDASEDRTAAIGQEYHRAPPGAPAHRLPQRATTRATAATRRSATATPSQGGFDFVALLHGDGQYAPEELPRMLAPARRAARPTRSSARA